MAFDHSEERLRRVLRSLSEHPLTDEHAYRVHLAVQGRAAPLRAHEVLAFALPKGTGRGVKGVEFLQDGAIRVLCEEITDEYRKTALTYAHPRLPPTVEELPPVRLFPPGESIFSVLARQTCGPVTIVRGKGGQQIEGTDHPRFAEIQRDTVRVVDGKLRYVGWSKSERFEERQYRSGPSLVVDGVATPIECGEYPAFLADGDDLYLLTLEVEQVREPEPEGMFSPGDDGKRRDARIRSLSAEGGSASGGDDRVNVVARHSCPDDWNFVARVGNRLVLTGTHVPYGAKPSPMSAVILLDDGSAPAFDNLRGHGRRVPGGALVACDTDAGPGFHWFHEEGGRAYPLHGRLEHISPAGERVLDGWHVEHDTLFLTRYDR